VTIAAALVALTVTLALLPVVTRFAFRVGAVATPRSDRWGRRAVPVLGGLAIAAGVFAGTLLIEMPTVDRVALLVGTAVMVAVGLTDDLGSVSPSWRVLIEAGVGGAFGAAVTGELPPNLRLAAIAVAAAIIPVAVNATNLVDNADGLASLLSAASGAALAGIVAVGGIETAGGALGLVVTASCLGFLSRNRPPARVFMGDSGSLMLGFVLAAGAVLIVRDAVLLPGRAHIAAAIAIPLVFALQIGDLAMVFTTRLRRHVSPFQGGVDHTSHRLVAAGLGPVGMLIGLSLLAAAVGAFAVAIAAWAGDFRLVAIAAIGVAGVVGAFEAVVAWRLPYGQERSADQPPVVAGRRRPAPDSIPAAGGSSESHA
jgi:UDP-N-acetylmuramyl pentapeptide phosphotransferase/UDP-N-acetylglucosamine-1-phosphate transferase